MQPEIAALVALGEDIGQVHLDGGVVVAVEVMVDLLAVDAADVQVVTGLLALQSRPHIVVGAGVDLGELMLRRLHLEALLAGGGQLVEPGIVVDVHHVLHGDQVGRQAQGVGPLALADGPLVAELPHSLADTPLALQAEVVDGRLGHVIEDADPEILAPLRGLRLNIVFLPVNHRKCLPVVCSWK